MSFCAHSGCPNDGSKGSCDIRKGCCHCDEDNKEAEGHWRGSPTAGSCNHGTLIQQFRAPCSSGIFAWHRALTSCAQELKGQRRGRAALEAVKENMVAETPAAGPSKMGISFTPAAPATLMRVPKLGEVFYSQRGASLFIAIPQGLALRQCLRQPLQCNTPATCRRTLARHAQGRLKDHG